MFTSGFRVRARNDKYNLFHVPCFKFYDLTSKAQEGIIYNMNSVQRKIKQAKIIAIILVFIGTVFYFAIPPKDHDCSDGIQDYDEMGIDCGGKYCNPCPPPDRPIGVENIKIKWVKAIPDGEDNYSLVAKIINPNSDWGIKSLDYSFNVYDENNNLIGAESGSDYVMPDISETINSFLADSNENREPVQIVKYIIRNDFKSYSKPSKTTLSLDNVVWKKIDDLKKPSLYITNKKFGYSTDGTAFYEASGVTNNKSAYSFNLVNIKAVLYDDFDRPIAARATNQWTVRSGQGWIFNFYWDHPIEEKVSRIDYQIETNILDEKNYIKEF